MDKGGYLCKTTSDFQQSYTFLHCFKLSLYYLTLSLHCHTVFILSYAILYFHSLSYSFLLFLILSLILSRSLVSPSYVFSLLLHHIPIPPLQKYYSHNYTNTFYFPSIHPIFSSFLFSSEKIASPQLNFQEREQKEEHSFLQSVVL